MDNLAIFEAIPGGVLRVLGGLVAITMLRALWWARGGRRGAAVRVVGGELRVSRLVDPELARRPVPLSAVCGLYVEADHLVASSTEGRPIRVSLEKLDPADVEHIG